MTPYTCNACNATNSSVLSKPALIICRQCRAVVHRDEQLKMFELDLARVPDDWSFVRIGTEFSYNNNTLTVVGRIRFQLRNDYKNFWCAALRDGAYIWIMESFASFCILGSTWKEFKQSSEKLRAGQLITLEGNLKIRGEYVEKCEEVTFEGELGLMKFPEASFFFIQCSNNQNQTAVFFIKPSYDIEYLEGGKIDVEKLNLKNTVTWDEWK
ncbi:MAG TPA: hypothetical protein VGD65_22175 [Chryseosolibacter sp.]